MTEYTADEYATKTRWDDIYKSDRLMVEIDENMPKITELFKTHEVTKILDLGCGAGRHTIYLADHGFDVYGIDISTEGIKKAAQQLHDLNLRATLTTGSIYHTLPYDSNFFDSVISIRVLHHGRIEAIGRAIKEIERVVKPNGFIFVTVRKRTPKKFRFPFKEIAPRTYVPLEGLEKGVVHYLFTKKILEKEFKAFNIHDIWVDSKKYYCLLGQKVG
ncbi:MAG: class I SAM-dependent methyltransferase [Theionarchaea archaeon]|nr:class I SAM-dependent methyltransferase [Theionarchaea archaeon]